MNKIPENKTRKRLRITLCVLYLFQLIFCAWPFYQFPQNGELVSDSVYEMINGMFVGDVGHLPQAMQILPFYLIYVLIPVIGFFFCAFDRERNVKNIVSLFLALAGVVFILMGVNAPYLSLGSTCALLCYLLISFLSSISIFARYTVSKEEIEKEKQSEEKNEKND